MPLLKAWIDPDDIGRVESELPRQMPVVSNDSMSQAVGEAVQMLDASGTDADWRLQRHTCADSPTYSLLPAGTQRDDPSAWSSQQLLIGRLLHGSASHWSSISSALQHSRGGLNPSFSLGGSLSHEYCRSSVGLSCRENLVQMVASNCSSDMDQDWSTTARRHLCG